MTSHWRDICLRNRISHSGDSIPWYIRCPIDRHRDTSSRAKSTAQSFYDILDDTGNLIDNTVQITQCNSQFARIIGIFYFKYITPTIGRIFSKDSSAYTYLPESVASFPDGASFHTLMQKVGFKNTKYRPLTFGICSIYTGIK